MFHRLSTKRQAQRPYTSFAIPYTLKKYVKNLFFIIFSKFHIFRKIQNFEISFFIDPGLDFKIPGGPGDQK